MVNLFERSERRGSRRTLIPSRYLHTDTNKATNKARRDHFAKQAEKPALLSFPAAEDFDFLAAILYTCTKATCYKDSEGEEEARKKYSALN